MRPLATRQRGDEIEVAFEKFVLGKLSCFYPRERLKLGVDKFTTKHGHMEKAQGDGAAIGIGMSGAVQFHADRSVDAEFFLEFAPEARFPVFSFLHFAAGKFPLEWMGIIGSPLADQNL